MTKAVIFDLDDTLFCEKEYILSGFSAVDSFLRNKGLNGFYERARLLFENGKRASIFDQVLDELDEQRPGLVLEMLDVYRNHLPVISLYQDAWTALQELRVDYSIGLLTDGYLQAQKQKTAALSLEDMMDVMIYSDEFGRDFWKPHKKPYELIMSALPYKPSEFIYVGDNPLKDFVSARKLGWKTVQIVRGSGEYDQYIAPGHEYRADYTIRTLDSLSDLLAGHL